MRRMWKVLLGSAVFVVLLVSCPTGSPPPPPPAPISISITPKAVTLNPEEQLQFTAQVNGTANFNVTWKADGGQIIDGTYSAPNETGVYTVRATSTADSSKSDAATVTVKCMPPSRPPPTRRPSLESLGGQPGRVNRLVKRSDGSLIVGGYGVFKLRQRTGEVGTWDQVGDRLPFDEVQQLIEANGTLFAASYGDVERLNPDTNTWEPFGQPLPGGDNLGLASGAGGWLYSISGIFGSINKAVYRVNCAGKKWEIAPGLQGDPKHLERDAQDTVYVATTTGIYQMKSGENVFQPLPTTGLPSLEFAAIPDFHFENSAMYVAVGVGVYRLEAGAPAWQQVGTTNETFYPQVILRRANGDLIVRNGTTLYRLESNTWVSYQTLFEPGYPDDMVELNGDLVLTGRFGVLTTRVLQRNFVITGFGARGLPGRPDGLGVDAGGMLYAVFAGVGIFFLAPDASIWTRLPLPNGAQPGAFITVAANGQVYAMGNGRVYASNATHTSWSDLGNPSSDSEDGLRLTASGALFAMGGIFDGGLYRFDQGAWLRENPVNGTRFSDLVFDRVGNGFASINMPGVSAPARGVWRRSASGSWEEFNHGLGQQAVWDLELDTQDTLYARAADGVYRRAAADIQWTLIQSNAVYAYDIVIDPLSRLAFNQGKNLLIGVNSTVPAFETATGGPIIELLSGSDRLFGIDATGVFRTP